MVHRVQEILATETSFQEKIAAFIKFISEMLVTGQPGVAEKVLMSSLDVQNDPEIKKIRTMAEEKMTGLLLRLIQEGKEQGQVSPLLSEEALRIISQRS